ncbi:AMP-binding protein [Enterococcus termitis]
MAQFFLDNQVFGNVALCMNNSIEYAIAYFGITFLGETIVPLNPNMSNENLLSELKFCDVTYMLVDKSQSDQIQKWILQEKEKLF